MMIWIQKKQKLEDKNGNNNGNFHGNCCNLFYIFVKKKFGFGSRTLTFLTMIHILCHYPPTPIYMMATRKCKILLNNVCNILHLEDECFVEIIWMNEKPVSYTWYKKIHTGIVGYCVNILTLIHAFDITFWK